ncbi:MAG: IS66 family insertion sequence element accessory protein TnpB [Myxococcaceae bacterium]
MAVRWACIPLIPGAFRHISRDARLPSPLIAVRPRSPIRWITTSGPSAHAHFGTPSTSPQPPFNSTSFAVSAFFFVTAELLSAFQPRILGPRPRSILQTSSSLPAIEPLDMRGNFDALAGAVRRLGLDPGDGHLYLSLNKRRRLAKALWFDGLRLERPREASRGWQLPASALQRVGRARGRSTATPSLPSSLASTSRPLDVAGFAVRMHEGERQHPRRYDHEARCSTSPRFSKRTPRCARSWRVTTGQL